MQSIAENLWIMRFPLRLMGTSIGRTVTLIRLASGELVIHSTAPFGSADVAAIGQLGRPTALVEATNFHDTYSTHARRLFPDLPYYVPEGFGGGGVSRLLCLAAPPDSWRGELEVVLLEGMPRVREHVFWHRPSRTLIVADLVFNFGSEVTPWTRWFFRWGAGVRDFPGMSRLFRFMIRDRSAFRRSMERVMQWDFDRVIVAHGDLIEGEAKRKLGRALARHGYVA